MSCEPHNGTATATPASGVPPYTYQWFRGGVPVGNTQTIDNLQAGTYSCIITDSVGCQAVVQHVVNAPYGDAVYIEKSGSGIFVSGSSVNRLYRYKDNDPTNFDYIVDETDNNFTTNDYTAPDGIAFVPDIDGAGNSGYIVVSRTDQKAALYDVNWKMIGLRSFDNPTLAPNNVVVDTVNGQYVFLSANTDSVFIANIVDTFNNATIVNLDSSTASLNGIRGAFMDNATGKCYVSGSSGAGATNKVMTFDISSGAIGSENVIYTNIGTKYLQGMTKQGSNLYIADRANGEVLVLSDAGIFLEVKSVPSAVTIFDVLIDSGFLYVTDFGLNAVHKISI